MPDTQPTSHGGPALSLNAQGILWALLAYALFAVAAAMAKIASVEHHVLQILFFRQLLVLLSCLPSIAKSFPNSLKTEHPGLHIIRLSGAFVALSCGLWAVTLLPLTTATTLGFAQVLFVALLALFFLKERVGVHRIGAVIVGFVGGGDCDAARRWRTVQRLGTGAVGCSHWGRGCHDFGAQVVADRIHRHVAGISSRVCRCARRHPFALVVANTRLKRLGCLAEHGRAGNGGAMGGGQRFENGRGQCDWQYPIHAADLRRDTGLFFV